ncbi:MAG TPA: hypothetical protein VNM14_14420 [Planctomycetota bacterium]|jgi:hypothetical protein|nr:hypothetical protein [Planctomycetota bacterium]
MRRLRDVLNPQDLEHLRRILGGKEAVPDADETQRRSRVKQISTDETYISAQSVEAFKALSQDERERLISEIVWRLTCHVEGSITRSPGKGVPLESGFRMRLAVQDGRALFVVKKG